MWLDNDENAVAGVTLHIMWTQHISHQLYKLPSSEETNMFVFTQWTEMQCLHRPDNHKPIMCPVVCWVNVDVFVSNVSTHGLSSVVIQSLRSAAFTLKEPEHVIQTDWTSPSVQ